MTTMTTVHADTASEGQLNWAVAKTLGMALREPVSAKDEDFAGMAVPFKLYDVFNSGSDEVPYYEIRVVTVTRHGILPDASAPTVDVEYFSERLGRNVRALSTVDFYFASREEAEVDVNASMRGSYDEDFHPVLDWNFVGEFIDDLDILFTRADRYRVRAFLDGRDAQGEQTFSIGENHREAAIRLYVKLKLGDLFEAPASI